MKKRSALFIPLMAGILIAQGIATGHIYYSNIDACEVISKLHQEGYLIVPNLKTYEAFKTFKTAFCGGIFFTLTIGVCITIISFVTGWLWTASNDFKPRFPLPLIIVWLGLAVLVNLKGLNWPATAYVIIPPPVVYKMTSHYLLRCPIKINRPKVGIYFVALVLCLLAAMMKFSAHTYIIIRDHLLLSNPLGQKINTFYYDYTLYAAQSFKSINQKIIRTADLSAIDNDALKKRLSSRLIANDYLPITAFKHPDLKIRRQEDQLQLCHQEKNEKTIPINIFFKNTKQLLADFSSACDNNLYFRNYLTGSSLLFNTVLVAFIFFFAPLLTLEAIWLKSIKALLIGALFTVLALVGLILLLPEDPGQNIETIQKPNRQALQNILATGNWHLKVNALKQIYQARLDIVQIPNYANLLTSPNVPERYWLARALSISRSQKANDDLFFLLKDKHFNVVCQAIRGLGKRYRKSRNKGRVQSRLIDIINTSDNWYVQRYAYLALRNLGWKQSKLH